MTVSAIIVTYNSAGYVQGVIESLAGSRGAEVGEIIVVDNASRDGSVSEAVEAARRSGVRDRLRVVRLGANMGFPYACNIGAAASRSRNILFLNPDIVLTRSCVARLEAVLEEERDVAAVQPLLLSPGGGVDTAGTVMDLLGHGYPSPGLGLGGGGARPTLYPCFACTMAPREVYMGLGGLDPSYFLYNEDLDYGLRAWGMGYRVVYNPSAVAIHVGGHSASRLPMHAAYFGRRNRLLTLIKDTHPLYSALAGMVLSALYILDAAARRDRRDTRIALRAITSAARLAKRMYSLGSRGRAPVGRLASMGLVSRRLGGVALRLRRLMHG